MGRISVYALVALRFFWPPFVPRFALGSVGLFRVRGVVLAYVGGRELLGPSSLWHLVNPEIGVVGRDSSAGRASD
jgi:hypothetical protein